MINRKILREFLPKMAYYLGKAGVELRCDEESYEVIKNDPKLSFVKSVPATEEDYYEEFLDLILAVKVVEDIDEAIAFIEKYGSKHSDAIITEDYSRAISTDKIHARGPMALEELTIPKFIILGEGQIRDNFGVPEEFKG